MTPDKTPSELDAFIETHMPAYWQYGATEQDRLRSLVQAALAKWGSPVVAGEPVATIKSWTNGSYWRNYNVTFHRDDLPVGTDLYTTPQPTQAQAGAVPLIDEQIRAMLNKHPPEDVCGWSYRMGIEDAELHHGIKGGQHGTE